MELGRGTERREWRVDREAFTRACKVRSDAVDTTFYRLCSALAQWIHTHTLAYLYPTRRSTTRRRCRRYSSASSSVASSTSPAARAIALFGGPSLSPPEESKEDESRLVTLEDVKGCIARLATYTNWDLSLYNLSQLLQWGTLAHLC